MKKATSIILAVYCLLSVFACNMGQSPKEIVIAFEKELTANNPEKAGDLISTQSKSLKTDLIASVRAAQKSSNVMGTKANELVEEKHKTHAAVSERNVLPGGIVLLRNYYLVKEEKGWRIADFKVNYAKDTK